MISCPLCLTQPTKPEGSSLWRCECRSNSYTSSDRSWMFKGGYDLYSHFPQKDEKEDFVRRFVDTVLTQEVMES